MIIATMIAIPLPGNDDARPLVIGLFESGGLQGASLVRGAESAVTRINAEGGVCGRPLELLRLSVPGPWRDIAGLMARAVFEEDLVAVVGPADRRGAHLAAQIVTRRRVPLLALSAGTALTRVKDPWIYQGVPDDREQAAALLRWAFAEPRGRSVDLVVPAGSDGEERARALEEVCASLGVTARRRVIPGGRAPGPAAESPDVDATLLWLDPGPALDYLAARKGDGGLVLASTRLDQEEFLEMAPEGCALPSYRSSSAGSGLEALAHDMVLALARSARENGSSAEDIRNGLAVITISGEAGEFRFDQGGRRQGTIPIWTRRGGDWVRQSTRKRATPAADPITVRARR